MINNKKVVVIMPAYNAEKTLEILKQNGEDAYIMGEVVKGEGGVIFA